METVLLVVHVIIALALIGMVLIQRSESDGFGLGSGGGSNFMTGRAAANFLTRTTAILATLFILNSLALGIIASRSSGGNSIVDRIEKSQSTAPAVPESDSKADEVKANDKAAAKEEKPAADKKPAAPAVPSDK